MSAKPAQWNPLDRARFAELQDRDRLQERHGRTWTVVGQPIRHDGVVSVVLRSGERVRLVPELFGDDYMLLTDVGAPAPERLSDVP